jgi:hypothetical protein
LTLGARSAFRLTKNQLPPTRSRIDNVGSDSFYS